MQSESTATLGSTEQEFLVKSVENSENNELSNQHQVPTSEANVKNEAQNDQLHASGLLESNNSSNSNGNDTELTKKDAQSPSVKAEDEPPAKKQKVEVSPNASVEPDETIPLGAPVHEIVGGSSIRQYLNKHLTKYLLEGLREVGEKKPQDPLTHLGEFLVAKGKEMKDAKQE